MNTITEYRIIDAEEASEIDNLALEALAIIGVDYATETSAILKKMKTYIELLLNEEDFDKEDFDKEDIAYKFGSLFGNLIRRDHNWIWYRVVIDEDFYMCITSPKEKVCNFCHNYFYSILNSTHQNNFVLLYNMIKKEYPKDWHFQLLT